MFDIYVYDADNGNLVDLDLGYSENAWKAVAEKWHHEKGHPVKVVDTFDGVVVYTLG